MKLFRNIELAFNDVWEVKKSRTFFRQLTDYFAMIFITLFWQFSQAA